MEIDHSGFDVRVAEEALDGLKIVVGEEEMAGVRVALMPSSA